MGSTVIAENDNWQDGPQAAQIQATLFGGESLAPSDPMESALIMSLNPGEYTAQVRGMGEQTGVGLVEVYKVGGSGDLSNISTRGRVNIDDQVMIGGFIIEGPPATVIVRALGASLEDLGVPGVLSNPALQLFSGPSLIAENDNWEDSPQGAQIQAATFRGESLTPCDPMESALMITLNPGAYTAQLRGVGGETGIGLVEVFRVD
jgi:hypothetical protein